MLPTCIAVTGAVLPGLLQLPYHDGIVDHLTVRVTHHRYEQIEEQHGDDQDIDRDQAEAQ